MIKTIGIVAKPDRADIPPLVKQILDWAGERKISVRVDDATADYLGTGKGLSREDLSEGCDLVVVFGGDGTLLSAARGVGDRETPLLAVNLGGLGFMMTTGPDRLGDALRDVEAGNYELDARMVLAGRVERGAETVGSFFALNDLVITKAAVARLLDLQASVNGEYICAYRSDGLIISTPTGSTAYSLAAGGPVMAPSVEAICLTPICPHTLSNRSVVLQSSAEVEVKVSGGDDNNFLSVDGQVGVQLEPNDCVRAWRAKHTVNIVQPRNVRFFGVLRSKMGWGER